MRDRDVNRKLREMNEYSKEQLRNASAKERLIHRITLTVFLLEFAFIAVGIIIAGIKNNFIYLGVAAGIFILTVIIGANINGIKRFFIAISIKSSKYKVKEFAEIIDDKLVGGTTVNGELTKAIMMFTFEVDGSCLTGYKVLKVKKLSKQKDFQSDEAYNERLDGFLNDIKENGCKLNIMYIPNKKHCIILNSADYVFNYFIVDVLFAENTSQKS